MKLSVTNDEPLALRITMLVLVWLWNVGLLGVTIYLTCTRSALWLLLLFMSASMSSRPTLEDEKE